MKKIFVTVVMVCVVALVLVGATAYMIQQKKVAEQLRLTTQAEEKIAAGDIDGGLQLLKRVDSQGGTAPPRTVYLLGKTLYERGRHREAMAYFKRLDQQYPKSPYAPDVLLYQARYVLEVEGKASAAKEQFLKLIELYPDSNAADFALYYLARISRDEGDDKLARQNLEIILKRPDSPARNEAEFLLGELNMKQLRSPEPGPDDILYTIKRGDSIWKLERQLKVPGDLIVGINNLNPKALPVGVQIKVPKINPSIVIDKGQRTLTLKNNGVFLKKYRVGIHRLEARVPAGEYTIQEKYEKGTDYTDPASGAVIKAGDPANPLGSRFLQLRRDMGIHGTNVPDRVGTYTDVGWITMSNADIEEIYSLVRKGTPVSIKGKNILEGSSGSK